MHIDRSQHTSSPSRPATRDAAAMGGFARGMRIGIAVSTYHDSITSAMREAAERAFADAGGEPGDLDIACVPGAFELIAASNALARRGDLDAVVAIGCIITGETAHDQYIAQALATGIAQAIVQTGVPIAFGVLTCRSIEQARERAGGSKGNKGEEAMLAAIEAARAVQKVSGGSGVEA